MSTTVSASGSVVLPLQVAGDDALADRVDQGLFELPGVIVQRLVVLALCQGFQGIGQGVDQRRGIEVRLLAVALQVLQVQVVGGAVGRLVEHGAVLALDDGAGGGQAAAQGRGDIREDIAVQVLGRVQGVARRVGDHFLELAGGAHDHERGRPGTGFCQVVTHLGDGRAEHLVVLHVLALEAEVHLLVLVGGVAEYLADPVVDRLQVIGHQQHGIVFLDLARVLLLAVDDHLEDAVFLHRHIEAAVLVATARAHARQGDVVLAVGNAVFLQVAHQLEQLAAGGVVGHAPQRTLRRVGDDARGLGIDQFVVIGEAGLCKAAA